MLVFFDIDGVLNTHDQNKAAMMSPAVCHGIDRSRIDNFNYIIKSTNAKCVLVSAWRYTIPDTFNLRGFEFMLRTHGFPEGCLIGHTCRDEDEPRGRGYQISRWLGENSYGGPYVVIDDLSPDVPQPHGDPTMNMHPLVTPRSCVGLTFGDAVRAVGLLRIQQSSPWKGSPIAVA